MRDTMLIIEDKTNSSDSFSLIVCPYMKKTMQKIEAKHRASKYKAFLAKKKKKKYKAFKILIL